VSGPWVGRSVLRREDDHILRGEATYVDNLAPSGTLHLVAVRSPLAHARLGGIDASEALGSPGAVAVLIGDDLAGHVHPMPINRMPDSETAEVPIPLLAAGNVRFAGEPVAAVVAETRAAAMDAAELVRVDYDPFPAVVDPAEALGGDVVLHEALGHNVLLRWRRTAGDVEGSFERAHRIVAASFHIPRLVAAPIEVRGALAEYDAERDLLTMWLSAQDPHRPLRHLATVLGRDPGRIRLVVRDVGGAFGSKGTLAPEAAVAAIAAMRLGRPVKWVEDRSENFLASYQGRGQDAEVELAVDADGRFLAMRARLVADLGAYLYPTTAVPVTTAMLVTGAYEISAVDVETVGVATNKVPTGPYRGAGRPEAAYVAERMADLAAAELGIDPAEIRRRNFIPPDRFPYESPLGYTYDSGNYARALDRACDVLGYDAVRKEQRIQREAGRVVGVGLSTFVERAGAGNWESGAVEVEPGGRIIVRVGSTPHGQGHHTVFAQIAADALGVHPNDVEVRTGDTAEIPEGVGSFASRSVTVGGSAVVEAAELLKEKARLVAAHVLRADPEHVRWEDGRLTVPGRSQLSLREVAEAANDPSRLPEGMAPGLAAESRFSLPGPVFPFGAYAVTVEVDQESGVVAVGRVVAVDDPGRVVNPMLAEGQVTGSILQGIGQALTEEAVYDDEGQPMTGSFTSYGILSATEAVPVDSEFLETPSPFNPLGAKGLGESGSIAVPAAVANAVADALSPFGVRDLDPPYTPEKVWRAIRRGRER
jgi:carbon-monoxide dehydrogenase large subunit